VYSYHFDRGNPFQCPVHGIAHHALDLAYTSGNFEQGFSDPKDKKLSDTLMKHWIEFANGKEPWASVATGKALHIRTDAEVEVVPREKVTSRRWDGYAEMEKCRDVLRKTGSTLWSKDFAA
jgi:carboxylesterase type B